MEFVVVLCLGVVLMVRDENDPVSISFSMAMVSNLRMESCSLMSSSACSYSDNWSGMDL